LGKTVKELGRILDAIRSEIQCNRLANNTRVRFLFLMNDPSKGMRTRFIALAIALI